MVSPLRPELYRQLQARFGKVLIANEGEEMVAHVDTDPSTGRLQLRVDWPGEYYRISCPYCQDTRCRLWINHRWGLYVPALKSDNLFLAHCYNEDCLARPGRAWELRDAVFSGLARGSHPDPVLPGQRLTGQLRPDHYRPAGRTIYTLDHLSADHRACVYVRSRGYDPKWLGREFSVGYCRTAAAEFSWASDRIIIPVYFRGQPVGWQARYIGEPPEGVPKWFSMKGMHKREVLYNFDVASQSPYVVVCEGVTDVWAYGPEAVALFGKQISGPQASLIASTWGQGVVVVLLDGDASDEALVAHDALGQRVRHKVIVPLPADADPGDCPREALREYVLEVARLRGVDLAGLAPGQ
jgi:hypothetical protein